MIAPVDTLVDLDGRLREVLLELRVLFHADRLALAADVVVAAHVEGGGCGPGRVDAAEAGQVRVVGAGVAGAAA